jgi:molybdenum cofactor synthesis domain-containing protein
MINTAVISISDTRKADNDISGDKLAELIDKNGGVIIEKLIATDDRIELEELLRRLAERDDIDLILTTGGTGFGPRDNTPEATAAVIEREAPGIAEAMRRETAAKHPMAMLSRGVCGIRGKTLLINFPGSPRGVKECFDVIQPVLKHAVALVAGDTVHQED